MFDEIHSDNVYISNDFNREYRAGCTMRVGIGIYRHSAAFGQKDGVRRPLLSMAIDAQIWDRTLVLTARDGQPGPNGLAA